MKIEGLVPPVNVALTQYKKGVRNAASRVAKEKPKVPKKEKVAGIFGGKSRAQQLYDEAVKSQRNITDKDRQRLKKERKDILRPNRIVPLKGLNEPYQRLMIAQSLNKKRNIT